MFRSAIALLVLAGSAICTGPSQAGTLQFTEVSAAAGVDVTNSVIASFFDHANYTGGGTVADFNNDGFQDLFVISGGTGFTRDFLFINNGDGTFTDRAEAWGLTHVHLGKGAGAGDINGDGFVDLFITSAGTFGRIGPGHHKLYRNNGNGTFTNISTTAGVNFSTDAQQGEDGFGVAFGDYDLDGDLDLFIAGFADGNNGSRLYRNNGDETFTDVTAASQIFANTPIQMRAFTPRFADMDGDRYPEMLLVADFGTSRYFRNNTDGTFTDITVAAGTSVEENGMGGTVGDFNGDGLLDWYVTSIYAPTIQWFGNRLYFNQGNHVYTEHALALGVRDGGYGWGTVAVDFDHDTRLDIAETNGDVGSGTAFDGEQSYLWIQNNDGTFTETALAVGFAHFDRGRGMSNFDYDNDGDQDVVIFSYGDPLRLFRNDLSGANTNWIRVLLDTGGEPGLAPNGFGAKVTVTAGGTTQVGWISSGDNFLSHSEMSAHFGLHNKTTVDTLRVDWPDGTSTTLSNVTANRTITVEAGAREQNCTNASDDDGDALTDCDDPDCCGLTGCQNGEGVCCNNAGDCDDAAFCNGPEQCIDDLCVPGTAPCPGQACDEGGNVCVDCVTDDDCDDGAHCNGPETCSVGVCVAGLAPCAGQMCNEDLNVCAECLVHTDCADDVLFCNGGAACVAGGCEPALDACAGRFCDEANDSCIGTVELQPRVGMPLLRLTGSQLERFEKGKTAFAAAVGVSDGLGPIYNEDNCAACHTSSVGGFGPATTTQFGDDDGQGGVDPLPGGPLLQAQAISGICSETLPPQADVTAVRSTPSIVGSGLIDAIDDAMLYSRVELPPAGVSGRAQIVPILEEIGETAMGRFGYKSHSPTARSVVAEELIEQIGLSNTILTEDNAPNGDLVLLASCDGVADPEDVADAQGFDTLERTTDYVRYLADPPQTPKGGMTGNALFNQIGCADCHNAIYFTKADPRLESAIYFQFIFPYSDFLLHDMGAAGDPMERGAGMPGEVRTTPLWGLRWRDVMWHDGRFSGGTWESRVRDAIDEHDVAGSEGSASAQAFDALAANDQDEVLAFLDSLGRAEFDHDGDNDVDADDLVQFSACFTGPGTFYTPDDACSISDVDQDGDVDSDDMTMFEIAADGASGDVSGLQLEKLGGGGTLRLTWSASCATGDSDYAIYEGILGSFTSHGSVTCSTLGSTQEDLNPVAGDTYYLVVPSTGFREGSYGRSSGGAERAAAGAACLAQESGACP